MDHKKSIPLGIKIIIGFHLLSIILWVIGQGGAVIAYDTVAKWGFQEPRELIDPVIVEVNRGIGLADFIIQIPLFILAAIGLWRLKFYGAVASWLVLGMTIYWPLVALGVQIFYGQAGVKYQPFDLGTKVLLLLFLHFALWASSYLYKNRTLFLLKADGEDKIGGTHNLTIV